jgi:hypothetical protein
MSLKIQNNARSYTVLFARHGRCACGNNPISQRYNADPEILEHVVSIALSREARRRTRASISRASRPCGMVCHGESTRIRLQSPLACVRICMHKYVHCMACQPNPDPSIHITLKTPCQCTPHAYLGRSLQPSHAHTLRLCRFIRHGPYGSMRVRGTAPDACASARWYHPPRTANNRMPFTRCGVPGPTPMQQYDNQ